MQFFLISCKSTQQIPILYAPDDAPLAFEVISIIRGKALLPFSMVYKENKLSEYDLGELDYQSNSFAWPFFSDKLRDIIQENLTGEEGLDWVTVNCKSSSQNCEYYIPRFSRKLDVLNDSATLFNKRNGKIIKPTYSESKVSNLSVFHKPLSNGLWEITSSFYISESIKKIIEKESLLGVEFEKIILAE